MERGRNRISTALREQTRPWVLGFSGGKDSSAVLVLLLKALEEQRGATFPIKIVYCDTGVEIPLAQNLTRAILRTVTEKFGRSRLNLECCIAEPSLDDKFFVRVIGRGYVTPTNRFRWCTDKIRIRPVEQLIRSFGFDEYDLLLGARWGESPTRDRTLSANSSDDPGYFKSANRAAVRNFLPIFDYTTNDVWETVIENERFLGVNASTLLGLYREASGECPIVADPKAPPCGTARFGCWTCTVVRRDRTTESLVEHGYASLAPLRDFRNWLTVVRDRADMRWRNRRNGQPGVGPFLISAREEILRKLLLVEIESGLPLIGVDEIRRIKEMWVADLAAEAALA